MDDDTMDTIFDLAESVTLFRMARVDERWHLDVVHSGARYSVVGDTLEHALDALFLAAPDLAMMVAE